MLVILYLYTFLCTTFLIEVDLFILVSSTFILKKKLHKYNMRNITLKRIILRCVS